MFKRIDHVEIVPENAEKTIDFCVAFFQSERIAIV